MLWLRIALFLSLCSGFFVIGFSTSLTACDLSSANLSCAPPSENESTPNPFFGQVPLFHHDFKVGFMGQPDFPMNFGDVRSWKTGIERQFRLNKRSDDNHFYLFHGSMPF